MKKDSHAEAGGQKPAAPIAIVGIGCIFPKARNLQEYWNNLKEGVDAITDIPDTHWNPDEYFREDPKSPDSTYAKKGGFIPEIDFDPLSFGILPNALEATDTSQLLSLVAAQDALRDAGYLNRELDRDRTSVIMGITGTQELVIPLGARLSHPLWRKALKDAGLDDDVTQEVVERISQSYVDWQESSFPGLLGNVVAGRIANKFNFGGTNCVVDAACASSMSAMHLAMMELQNGKADMVLTGGVDTFNHVFMYVCFSKTPALSPSGHARPFDHRSDGTTLGEGIGVLALKRLADAERDGDKIYAVIKGVGSSSDGGGTSIYAPTKDGQKKAYKNAYESAGVTPQTIELLEAHGTGTAVGDAMEIQGLTEAYSPVQTNGSWCALGSVKSQIGHTKAAAGVAGIIKGAMALYNKVLPPTIKVEKPAKPLEDGNTPFYVNTQKRPWVASKAHPRRAAVSSFGFGGSNFHCVLEEYSPRQEQIDWSGNTQILAFSSDSLSDLKSALNTLDPTASWNDLRSKAARLRQDFDSRKIHRLLMVVEREQSSLERLLKNAQVMLEKNKGKASWSTPDGIFYGQGDVPGKLGIIFPGQGSQYVDMLKDLSCQFPQFQDTLDSANQVFQSADEKRRLSDLIYPHPSFSEKEAQAKSDILQSTQVAQPAIGTVSLAALKIFEFFGLKAESLAGHSFGELVGLCAAKVLDTDTFFAMSKLRGQLMGQKDGDKGSMLAVQADLGQVEKIIEEEKLDLVIANKNSPQQTVLSGATSEVERAANLIKARDLRCKQLNVAAAFHSSFVSDASGAFLEALKQVDIHPPQIPVYADSTAELYPNDADDIRQLLAGQLANPVDFLGIIENMYESGVRTFFEVGPSSQMNGLIKAILEGKDVEVFSLDSSKGQRSGEADLARALSQLSSLGYAMTLTAWDEGVAIEDDNESKPKKRKMTVTLNGANYFKPKAVKPAAKRTVTAQVPAKGSEANTSSRGMNVKPSVSKTATVSQKHPAPQAPAVHAPPAAVQNKPVASPPSVTAAPAPMAAPQKSAPVPPESPANHAVVPDALRMTQENLRALQQFQQQTADLHRQFLEGQEATRQSFEMLFSRQQQLLLGSPQPQVQQTQFIPQSQAQQPVAPTVQYAAPSLPDVETVAPAREAQVAPEAVSEPVTQHAEAKPVQVEAVQQEAVSAPQASPEAGTAEVEKVLMAVVAEKTGYPEDMLDLDMGLDADLGIDSIKRVEILSALQEQLPQAPEISSDQIGSIQTLGQIVELLGSAASTVAPALDAPSADAGSDSGEVEKVLLGVVSEKTGYPEDMLDLDMGLDADLGIDSIKRVEILSALQSLIPGAPEISSDQIGQIQNLRQIVEFLSVTVVTPKRHSSSSEKSSSASVDSNQVRTVLLQVVSEKTGYPEDMLDLDMGLDADLGIDSIKRVEILSALQSQLPDAPEINSDQIGQIQNLQQIVDFLSSGKRPTQPQESQAAAVSVSVPTQDAGQVEQTLLQVVAEKTGYPEDMLDLDMGLDVDLGIDSIKRVEILSALQTQLPDAPEINSDQIGQIQTLHQIVEFLSASTKKKTPELDAKPQESAPVDLFEDPMRSLERSLPVPRKIAESLARQAIQLPHGSTVCLVSDPGVLRGALSQGLQARGLQVKHLSWDQSESPNLPESLSGLILLVPESEQIRMNFPLDAFTLLQAAGDALKKTPSMFITISRLDGHFGFGNLDASGSVISGGLAGLTKTVAREWPEVFCKAIDLDPNFDDSQLAADAILDEMFLAGPVEVGISSQARVMLQLERAALELSDSRDALNPGDLLLVSGGARGVTAECALSMAKAFQPTIALIGRSPLPEQEPEWLVGLERDADVKKAIMTHAGRKMTPKEVNQAFKRLQSNREISQNIARIEAAGSRVLYRSVDVRDAAAVQALVQELRQECGPVRGLVHGAGVLADRKIEDKTPDQLDRVYGTKVEGFLNLLNALQETPLRVLTAFSSTTARFGRIGQVDYAIANEVLNKLTQQYARKHPECRAVSVNWGPWAGGMVTAAHERIFKKEGIEVIPLRAGADYLVQELSLTPDNSAPREVVILGAGTQLEEEIVDAVVEETADNAQLHLAFERELNVETHPFLRSHVIGGRAVLPMAMTIEWMAHAALHGNPGLVLQGFNDLRILKGVILEKNDAVKIQVMIGEARKEGKSFLLPVELLSVDADGKRTRHARAAFVLGGKQLQGECQIPNRELAPFAHSDADIYEKFLFHGPDFHGIQKVEGCSPEGIAVAVSAAPSPSKWLAKPLRNHWLTDPLMVDCAFQMMILWSFENHQAGSLPTFIRSYRQFKAKFPKEGGRIVAQITQNEKNRAMSNIEFLSPDGSLIACIENYECTIDASLNKAFRENQIV